jgi:hypothetical protein
VWGKEVQNCKVKSVVSILFRLFKNGLKNIKYSLMKYFNIYSTGITKQIIFVKWE